MVKRLIGIALLGTSLQVNAECFPVTEVLKVVDGDTVDVQIRVKPVDLDMLANMRIRMEGINAWESRTSNAEEKVKGLAAKSRLSELVLAPITVCLSAIFESSLNQPFLLGNRKTRPANIYNIYVGPKTG